MTKTGPVSLEEIVELYNAKVAEIKQLKKENKELKQETQQIKQLIHTMLNQINIENIGSDDALYSARIIFTVGEFETMRDIWKMGR